MPRKKKNTEAVPPTVTDDMKIEPSAQKDYLSEADRTHLNFVRTRMQNARDIRNAPRDEYDGMGYLEAFDRDTKSGLAYTPAIKNDGESKVSTGTTRQALMSLISRASSYSYFTEFSPFDRYNNLLADLGMALEVSVAHANYLIGDAEKVKERGNELFTHGDIISYEDWVVRWGMDKSRPDFDGKISGVTWTEKKKKVFEGCERRTVQGRRFYFGDIFTDSMDNQPFCFEVNHISYSDAKQKYGDWERFQYVRPRTRQAGMDDTSSFAEDWRLEDGKTEDLEEILYVDVPNNEMQIVLGGVPMVPIGFPMKWAHGRYPWAHQGAEPIRTGFIYHRSFVRTLLNMQDIENDLWRVLIMLAWKAAAPPMANQTGRIITRRNLMAGEILDVNADQLKPLFDGSLANTGFIDNVLAKIRDNMTGRSVPEIKQGMVQPGLGTATETVQVQKEAEIALSMNLTALASIQAKADRLMAMNIMDFAFRNGRGTSFESPREGGTTRYVIEAVDDFIPKEELRKREVKMTKGGKNETIIIQVRKNAADFVDNLEARSVSRPKQSSYLERQELTQMFQAATALFGQRLDPKFLEELFRSAYRVPRNVSLTLDIDPTQIPGVAPTARPQPMPQSAQLENVSPSA